MNSFISARATIHNFLPARAGATQRCPLLPLALEDPGSGPHPRTSDKSAGLSSFYSGQFPGRDRDRENMAAVHRQYDALCLEPQAYPDTPNRPDYPSARLDPGQTYRHIFAVSIFREVDGAVERGRSHEGTPPPRSFSGHHCPLSEGCT